MIPTQITISMPVLVLAAVALVALSAAGVAWWLRHELALLLQARAHLARIHGENLAWLAEHQHRHAAGAAASDVDGDGEGPVLPANPAAGRPAGRLRAVGRRIAATAAAATGAGRWMRQRFARLPIPADWQPGELEAITDGCHHDLAGRVSGQPAGYRARHRVPAPPRRVVGRAPVLAGFTSRMTVGGRYA